MAQARFAPLTFVLLATCIVLIASPASGQGPSRERFLPADQLDAILEKNPNGVMLPRDEFRTLLKAAQDAASASDYPAAVVAKSTSYSVKQDDQHAIVELNVTVEQFEDEWSSVEIPNWNLFLERATIDGKPAVVGQHPRKPDSLVLLHREPGEFVLKLSFSTPLRKVGNDQFAVFRTLANVPGSVSVECPANRILEANKLKLERPAEIDQPTTYEIPAGNRSELHLRWTTQRQQAETQTLVFCRTSADLLLTTDSSRWDSTTRVSVFGNSINEVIARIPNQLEITSVDSAGLEAWKLEDDTERNSYTRLILTYRQPFSEDRIVRVSGVNASSGEESFRVPTLEFLNINSHSGRINILQKDQLRLMATVSSGIRHVGTNRAQTGSPGSEVFDFWLQDYTLNVAVKPRDQELFAEVNSTLTVVDTTASFLCEATVETLNAPLFELGLQLPSEWQLKSITDDKQQIVKWRKGVEDNQVVVEPAAPIPADGLLALKISLQRTIEDPTESQTLSLPVVEPLETTVVGGTYRLTAAGDLTITPQEVTGLSAINADAGSLLFETLTSDYSGEVSVLRKPTRLAARGIVTSWMDTRMKTTEATITVDVVNGTTRTLQLELPEDLGDELRFQVVSVTAVPGIQGQAIPTSLAIIEQTPGNVAEGVRTFDLTFDKRFLGAVTLSTRIEQPRDDDTQLSAAFVRVPGAVRQHGLVAFQSYPEQQLTADAEAMTGLKPADPGLVQAPAPATGRRTALVFRYIQPVFSLAVAEERYDTETVPSAVCTLIKNISVLSETGTIQRSCGVYFKCSGVQTLRFTLPDADSSYLWSTVLNDKAVEVRRDGDDYLVAIPTNSDVEQHHLEILFETATATSGSGSIEQQSISLAIDTEKGSAEPIDILQQSWVVRYPKSSLLVAQSGGFVSQRALENPGWLQQLSKLLRQPSWETVGERLVPVGIFVVALFVFTALIVKRRWKSFAAYCCLAGLGGMVFLGSMRLGASFPTDEMFVVNDGARVDVSGGAPIVYSMEDEYSDGYEDAYELEGLMEEADMEAEPSAATAAPMPEAPGAAVNGPGPAVAGGRVSGQAVGGGLGGGMGGGGFGGAVGGLGGFQQGQTGDAQAVPSFGSRQLTLPDAAGVTRNGQPGAGFGPIVQNGNGTVDRFSRSNQSGGQPDPVDQPHLPLGGPAGLQSHTIRNAAPIQLPPPPADGIISVEHAPLAYAGKLTGGARLSIRASVASPSDYQAKKFQSLGGTEDAGRLSLTIQDQSRLNAYRIIAAAIALLLCLNLRNAPTSKKTALATVLLFIAIAAVPLAPNQWQSLVDGLLIGTLLGVALWLLKGVVSCTVRSWKWCCNCCCRCCGWIFRSKTAAATGVFIATASLSTFTQAQTDVPRPDVVLPYTPGEPELLADHVFLSKDEFLKLYRQANPDEFSEDNVPQKDAVLAAYFSSGDRRQVEGEKWSQGMSGRFVVRTFRKSATVPLPIGQIAIRKASLNENEAVLVPIKSSAVPLIQNKGQQAPNAPAQQAEAQQQAKPQPTSQQAVFAYGIHIEDAGMHVVDIDFDVPASIENDVIGRVDLPLLPVAAGTLTFEVPSDNLDIRVNGRSNRFRRDGKTLIMPISDAGSTRIEWRPSTARRDSDVVAHATVNSALTIDDAGLTLHSTLAIKCRQGELSEVDIAVPGDYAVQSVSSPELASWTLEAGDEPRLKVQFQKPVDESTTINLTMFRNQVVTDEELMLDVPVPALVGASRDSGMVTVIAGRELEVRVHSLSGVSQLNPSDAVLPVGPAKDARRVLAWRYTRHPLAISVRAFRTSEELKITSLNGVQLESQRQLWTTLIKASISGAPRRRLEIVVPKDFLALEVTGNDLADWYYTDAENSDEKVLNLQLNEARTGTINAVIQGQTGTTPTMVSLTAPRVPGADPTSSTEISVWLDQATTIRNFTAEAWKKSSGVSEVLKLKPTAPAISFSARGADAKQIQLNLDEMPAAFVCESVVVTNVTETSVELTLGMKWDSSANSAAKTFSFSVPAALADVYDFTIPGLRQLDRLDDDDTVRFTAHLQQPVAGRFFVLGAGSMPLPDSGQISAQPPEFLVPDGSKSSITSQSHYWVIVNQSAGLLQPVDVETDGDDIAATDISTKIPQGFLDQSVAIRRLRPESPNSPWQLKFPLQEKVSPAVVALAAHATVIASDGTWRSRHTLTVRNESRQFLPVIIPADSRFLYALVGGQPTRIVSRTLDDQQLHLIPIPQSGVAAIPFDVQIALAGTMSARVGSVEGRPVKIPIPIFPEYKDSPEYGITISRNTWSVYVPEDWNASLESNPRRSNVITATIQDFDLAILGCVTDNSRSMINSLKSTRQKGIADAGLLQNLAQQRLMLESQVAATESAEAERLDVLQQLYELVPNELLSPKASFESGGEELDYGVVQQSDKLGQNYFLNNNDIMTNDFNAVNNGELLMGNSARAFVAPAESSTPKFNFALPDVMLKKSIVEDREVAKKQSKSKLNELQRKVQSKGKAAQSQRSRLLNRRESNRQLQLGRNAQQEVEQLQIIDGAMVPQQDVTLLFDSAQLPQAAQQNTIVAPSAPGAGAEYSAESSKASEGQLSLNFQIPERGVRHDFVRTGGNAQLTLNVSDREATSAGLGIVWALGCAFVVMLLLKGLEVSGRSFVYRALLLVSIASLAGWIFLPSPLRSLCVVVCIVGLILISLTLIVRSFLNRKPVSA